MIWLPLFILALVQGLTEFLPISSSGHLVLVHHFLGSAQDWQNHMILDVAVHVGTLFSVLVYFRRDVIKMLRGLIKLLRGDCAHEGARLNIYLLAASIPVIAAGLALHIMQPAWILLLNVMAIATIIFGVLLWVADRMPQRSKTLSNMNIKDAALIGIAQAFALIPGTSRSGATMSAARFLGYSRSESAHFSLLLAIIAIAGAGTLGTIELIESGDAALGFDAVLAAVIAFFAGWGSIALMMKWVERIGFTPFAIYRILLGAALLIFLNYPW